MHLLVVGGDAAEERRAQALLVDERLDVGVVAAKDEPGARAVVALAGPDGALLDRADAVGGTAARLLEQRQLVVPEVLAVVAAIALALEIEHAAVLVGPRDVVLRVGVDLVLALVLGRDREDVEDGELVARVGDDGAREGRRVRRREDQIAVLSDGHREALTVERLVVAARIDALELVAREELAAIERAARAQIERRERRDARRAVAGADVARVVLVRAERNAGAVQARRAVAAAHVAAIVQIGRAHV